MVECRRIVIYGPGCFLLDALNGPDHMVTDRAVGLDSCAQNFQTQSTLISKS